MSRVDRFLDKYRELEEIARSKYQLTEYESAVGYLLWQREYFRIKDDLDLCLRVRNLLSHKRKVFDAYAVEPSEEMISFLEDTIQKVKHPLRAKDIAIGINHIYKGKSVDTVLPFIKIMNEKSISHIPIVENDIVKGVFSDNTIMEYLLDETIIETTETMRFSDLEKYLPLDAHKADSFRFVSMDTLLTEINDIFAEAISKGDRIGLVFVTAHGKKTEKLLGIITAWDLAAGGKE